MQETTRKVYCQSHNSKFTVPASSLDAVCTANGSPHPIITAFPHTTRLFYCCECEHYWIAAMEGTDFIEKCPACKSHKSPHFYACDKCKVTMMDFSPAKRQKSIYIMPWGQPHPHCPGCGLTPNTIPQTHFCSRLNGLLTTALDACPFCESNVAPASREATPETPPATIDAQDTRPFTPASDPNSTNEFVQFSEENPQASKASPELKNKADDPSRSARLEKIIYELELVAQQEESKRKAAEEKVTEYATRIALLEHRIRTSEERAQGELGQAVAQAEARVTAAEAQASESRASLEELGRRFREKGERYQAEFQRLRKEVDQFAQMARASTSQSAILPLAGIAPANVIPQNIEKKHQAEINRIIAEGRAVLNEVESFARQRETFLIAKVNEAVERARAAERRHEIARREITEARSKIELLELKIRTAATQCPHSTACPCHEAIHQSYAPARI